MVQAQNHNQAPNQPHTQLQKLNVSYCRISIISKINFAITLLFIIASTIEFFTTPLFSAHNWLGIFITFLLFIATPVNIVCLVNLGNLRIEPAISQLKTFRYASTATALWVPLILTILYILIIIYSHL